MFSKEFGFDYDAQRKFEVGNPPLLARTPCPFTINVNYNNFMLSFGIRSSLFEILSITTKWGWEDKYGINKVQNKGRTKFDFKGNYNTMQRMESKQNPKSIHVHWLCFPHLSCFP